MKIKFMIIPFLMFSLIFYVKEMIDYFFNIFENIKGSFFIDHAILFKF